ncbi:MAG: ABC transporter ATP-binding protein [Planctomycetota bacterium]
MIELKRVSRLYGKVIGVNDLNVKLAAGAYGLVGPNGSGKTTLINLLTGQLRPTLGSVRVFGEDPWHQRDMLRRIGLCPASDVLYPNVSASEWVQYQVRLHGFSLAESRERAHTALDRVDMTDRMHRPMGSYSLGMRQRTKIAQAIAHDPDLLILDEPYNGLDPVGRYQMTEMLVQYAEEGRSLLFASHVLHEIEAITSSFMLIHGGRLLASGTAAEIDMILADTPREVTLHGEDVTRLASRLIGLDWVDSISLNKQGNQLTLALLDPQELYRQLAGWIASDGLRIDRLQAETGELTAVLDSLLQHHRGEAR